MWKDMENFDSNKKSLIREKQTRTITVLLDIVCFMLSKKLIFIKTIEQSMVNESAKKVFLIQVLD